MSQSQLQPVEVEDEETDPDYEEFYPDDYTDGWGQYFDSDEDDE